MSNERRGLFGTTIPTSVLSRPSPGRRNDEPGMEGSENLKLMAKIGVLSVGVVFSAIAALKSFGPEPHAQKPPSSASQSASAVQPEKYNDLDR